VIVSSGAPPGTPRLRDRDHRGRLSQNWRTRLALQRSGSVRKPRQRQATGQWPPPLTSSRAAASACS